MVAATLPRWCGNGATTVLHCHTPSYARTRDAPDRPRRRRDHGDRRRLRPHAIALSAPGPRRPRAPRTVARRGPPGAAAQRHLAETLGGSPNDFELSTSARPRRARGATMWAAQVRRPPHRRDPRRLPRSPWQVRPPGWSCQSERSARRRRRPRAARGEGGPASCLAGGRGTRQAAATAAGRRLARRRRTAAEQAVWRAIRRSHGTATPARRRPRHGARASAPSSARHGARRGPRRPSWLRVEVEALGGPSATPRTSAPLVFVDLPPAAVAELAALPTRSRRSAWSERGGRRCRAPGPPSGPTGPAARGPGQRRPRGGGRVSQRPRHRRPGRAGRASAQHDRRAGLHGRGLDHPTWVAGAISRTQACRASRPAPASSAHRPEAAARALTRDRRSSRPPTGPPARRGGDADIINASIGQDTATGAEEARRYFDAIVDQGGRLAVAAAGNFTTFGHWDIVSPGTGLQRADRRRRQRPRHGQPRRRSDLVLARLERQQLSRPDRRVVERARRLQQAERVGPGSVRHTANGLGASGTSVASPIVAGIAAQLHRTRRRRSPCGRRPPAR